MPTHRCLAVQVDLARGSTSVTRKFMMRLFMSSLRTVTAASRLFQSSAEIFRFCSHALVCVVSPDGWASPPGLAFLQNAVCSFAQLLVDSDLQASPKTDPDNTSRGAMVLVVASCKVWCQAALSSSQEPLVTVVSAPLCPNKTRSNRASSPSTRSLVRSRSRKLSIAGSSLDPRGLALLTPERCRQCACLTVNSMANARSKSMRSPVLTVSCSGPTVQGYGDGSYHHSALGRWIS